MGEPLATGARSCCVGVDVPGVGYTHSYDCPNANRTTRIVGREHVAGEVPEPLRSFFEGAAAKSALEDRRESLFAQLLFAARDLANYCMGAGRERTQGVCVECGAGADGLGHAPGCRTGRVLGLIDELLEFNPTEKEAAPEGDEQGHAGDGIRPRGLQELVCLKCGARGGSLWEPRRVPNADFQTMVLALNECADALPTISDMRVIYTHRCRSALRGVDALFGYSTAAKTAQSVVDDMLQKGGAQ
jgi:hypothetical protein